MGNQDFVYIILYLMLNLLCLIEINTFVYDAFVIRLFFADNFVFGENI